MQMAQERTVPLHECGTAPRILITDFDRVEILGDGLYTYVGTCPMHIDGNTERQVVVYITITWRAVAKGIMLSAIHVAELTSLADVVAQIKKAVQRLTMH